MIDSQNDNLVPRVVDSIHDPECPAAGDPHTFEFTAQRLADTAGRVEQVTGDERDDGHSNRLGQDAGDGPGGRAGKDELVGR